MDLWQELTHAWQSRYPLVWVASWDEARVEQRLQALARAIFQKPDSLYVWTCIAGFGGASSDTRDPLQALEFIEAHPAGGIFMLKDFAPWLNGHPGLVRKLRDLYYRLRTQPKMVVMVSPDARVPELLKRELYLIPVDIPTEAEIVPYLQALFRSQAALQPWQSLVPRLAATMRGLTFNEIFHLVQRLAQRPLKHEQELFETVFDEKEQLVRKESALEYVPPRWSLEDLGGMDVLKDWLRKRAVLFTPEARRQDLPRPKGILIMGISGCGKSLAVKCVSSLWNLPLFRLDMNLIFSGAYGEPEWVFHQALRQVEAIAPAVLWIDEIEMGVGRYHETGGEGRSHIFSSFLTWLQERAGDVFVAATANRIHLLPAELLRKGRFDQIFYVDLPDDEERKEIFRIHLRKQGVDPAGFDMVALAAMTKGWTGAEIEQAVVSARIEALHEGVPMTMDHLVTAVGQIVPLSKTMEDQIKAIKAWAYDRALPASSSAAKRYR